MATIRESKGITINNSNLLYGGLAFSASYSVGFGGPSRCSISFLSTDGKYEEEELKNRIKTDGATDWDSIRIGEWGPLKMHPLSFTIQEQPSGNVLQITYYDRSINFLDKYFVLLDKRNVPTKAMNSDLRKKLDADEHIIIVGTEFIKSPTQKSIKPQTAQEQSNTIRGEMLYTASELGEAIKDKGSIDGTLSNKQMKLLTEFGVIEREGEGEGKNENPNADDEGATRAGYKGQGYLYGFNGSLRTVLNSWGQKLGFTFYWHPTKDEIFFMDLRGGIAYKDMEDCIDKILTKAKNIIGRTYTYSIEDSFSQGASAYFGMDGAQDGKQVTDTKYILDVLNYPSYKCLTSPHRNAEDGEVADGVEDKIWYDYKYLPQTESVGSDIKDLRPWDAYLPDRTSASYMGYVRLVKAAALGAEFFATYVLMKKIANEPFQEGTEDYASPQLYGKNVGPKGDLDEDGGSDSVALDHDGSTIEESLGYSDIVSVNDEVDIFFHSSGAGKSIDDLDPDGDEAKARGGKKGQEQKFNRQDESGNWIYGDDCLTARLLNPKLTISSMIKSSLNVDSAMMSVLDSVFFGDTAKPDFWYFGEFAKSNGKDFNFGTGPLVSAHNYPLINRLFLARVSDYPLNGLMENPGSNHQFQILNAIARFSGRFYVGRSMETQREFKRRNYVEDNPQAIYKNTDVKDTPLGELYEALELVHGAAAKEMPNTLITQLLMHGSSTCQTAAARDAFSVDKDRASTQANYAIPAGGGAKDPCEEYNGNAFASPANSARPTLEQFICSIYTTKHSVQFDGVQAQFANSISATRITADTYELGESTIFPSNGGSGYSHGIPPGLTFTAVVLLKGVRKEIAATTDPTFTMNLEATVITSIDIIDGGLWDVPEDSGVPMIEIKVEKGKGTSSETNLFENTPADVAKEDSIRKVNIDARNATKIEQCCPIDLDQSILLFDEGDQLVIPDLLKPHVDRIGKFGNSAIDITNSNIATILKDSYIVLLPYLYTIDELKDKYGTIEGTEDSGDELDWIVDQVQIGGTFFEVEGDGSFEIPVVTDATKVVEEDETNEFCGEFATTYLLQGDKFEYCHIIRPDDAKKPGTWKANVREDQFGSPKGQFLTPSLEDLGIPVADCCPGDTAAKKKCKEDREEDIIGALTSLCLENSFDQDEPINGLSVTLAGTAVTDENGNPLSVSSDSEVVVLGYPSIPEGLEKLEVQIDGGGETASLTLSAKRKVRIFKSEANISLWMPLGPRVENKLIGE
tara:strand:- start:33195 stop:36953 length:3759 start_codon:yes stop_codon:yes gene_type:complete